MATKMQVSDRIGFRMKLHDLHVLLAVVQTGSMSKAIRDEYKKLNGQPVGAGAA